MRDKQIHLNVSQKNQHKPAESDARMHKSQHLVSFPEIDVNQAIEEDVLYVFPGRGGSKQRLQDFFPVTEFQLMPYPDHPDNTVRQDEYHSKHKR